MSRRTITVIALTALLMATVTLLLGLLMGGLGLLMGVSLSLPVGVLVGQICASLDIEDDVL